MIKFKKNLISIVMAFILLLSTGLFTKTVFATSYNVSIYLYSENGEHFKDYPVKDTKLKIFKLKDYPISDVENNDTKKKEIVEKLKNLDEEALTKISEEVKVTSPSDENGLIFLSLEKGVYYAREISDDTKDYEVVPFVFTVSLDSEIVTKFVNKKPPTPPTEITRVRLLKVSNDEKVLEKVGFKLYMRTANGDIEVPLNENSYDENGSSRVLYTDAKGEIIIDKLPLGDYIFREVEPLSGYVVKSTDTAFKIVDGKEVSLKVVNDKTSTGKKLFVKVSSGKKRVFLEGAVFKVMTKENDKFIPVQRDGKDYEITSEKNGMFVAEDLPFGTYYLVETKAPTGYRLLSESIEFTIDENSKTNEAKVIENKPFEEVNIPRTGDILFLVLTLGGITIFTMGYFISRDKKKKQN